jgi:hypothetical protein
MDIKMKKSLLEECIEKIKSANRYLDVFGDAGKYYFRGQFKREIKWVPPDTPERDMPGYAIEFYKQKPSKKEFFEDRPWLPKDEALYIQYLKDRLDLRNEYAREVYQHDSKINRNEAYKIFKLKKDS